MGEPARKLVSYVEYLDEELATGIRHEFIDGEIFAMAGGTLAHADIASAFLTALRTRLEGSPCRAVNSDARLHIEAAHMSTYPDVGIVCGGFARAEIDHEAYTNPSVLVEVLSRSTADYDRAAKFDAYRQLPTLAAYVLVSTTEPLIELRTRQPDGSWLLRFLGPEDTLALDVLGISLPVGAVYAGVELDPPPPPRSDIRMR